VVIFGDPAAGRPLRDRAPPSRASELVGAFSERAHDLAVLEALVETDRSHGGITVGDGVEERAGQAVIPTAAEPAPKVAVRRKPQAPGAPLDISDIRG
jgi:hypothetical protein